MIEKLLIVVLVVASYTYASKMCGQDEDCADLGDVFCMKSRCQWGLCGCPRGQAMRFLGSEKKFQCVPIRRVGESCSTDGDKGVCGAMNAECIDGKCICDHSDDASPKYYSYWGGERCATQSSLTSGETCSESLGDDTGDCSLGAGEPSTCEKGNSWWEGEESPLDFLPNTCGCPSGYRVALANNFEDHDFTGNFIPKCVPIKINELCLRDKDCSDGGQRGMECTDKKCACTTTDDVPDILGTTCKPPLGYRAPCKTLDTIGKHCDGTLGLVCGDVCDLENYGDPAVDKCVCDPSYADSGSRCTKATEDTSCDRDYQCKSLSRTAVCVEGICKAGAAGVYVSLVLMLGVIVLTHVFHF